MWGTKREGEKTRILIEMIIGMTTTTMNYWKKERKKGKDEERLYTSMAFATVLPRSWNFSSVSRIRSLTNPIMAAFSTQE